MPVSLVSGLQRKDARSLAIDTLSREWPLSAKQIFNKIKDNANQLTYQGVHKALHQLEEEQIVFKNGSDYALDSTWIAKTADALNALRSKYAASDFQLHGDILNLTFNNAFEVDQFLIKFVTELHAKKNEVLLLQWNHFWIPLFFPRQTYLQMKDFFLSCKPYAITPSNTVIDRWCAGFWEKAGLAKKLGVPRIHAGDFIAFRDLIIQVHYPIKLLEQIDKVYKTTHIMMKFDADLFFERTFLKQAKIPVVVIRNAALADQLRIDILSHFRH